MKSKIPALFAAASLLFTGCSSFPSTSLRPNQEWERIEDGLRNIQMTDVKLKDATGAQFVALLNWHISRSGRDDLPRFAVAGPSPGPALSFETERISALAFYQFITNAFYFDRSEESKWCVLEPKVIE